MSRKQHNADRSSHIYGITKPRASLKVSPNILPCRINHDGPVNATKRYWNPKIENDRSTAYFRGRKLHGTKVDLPSGYRGVVLRKTDKVTKDDSLKQQAMQELESKRFELDPENYAQEESELRNAAMRGELDGEEVHAMDEVASFDKVTIWGHDATPDRADDPFARGVDEWLAFAQAMHAKPETDDTGKIAQS